jgi:hypothetical protein
LSSDGEPTGSVLGEAGAILGPTGAGIVFLVEIRLAIWAGFTGIFLGFGNEVEFAGGGIGESLLFFIFDQ